MWPTARRSAPFIAEPSSLASHEHGNAMGASRLDRSATDGSQRRTPMAHTTSTHELANREHPNTIALRAPSRQAFEILHWGFVAAPVLFGLDKFAHLMTNWDGYLAPAFAKLSP